MKNAVILHGTSGSADHNWFPWLKTALETNGYKVWVPNLPSADRPNIQRYNYFLFDHGWEFNDETILIGHSSGAVAILGLLQALPISVKVKASYLVGSFKDNLGRDDLSELFAHPFDFDKIKQKSRAFYFIHSDNDPYCPLEHAQFLHAQIGGDLIILPGQKHFSVGTFGPSYTEFPYLRNLILSNVMTAEVVTELYQTLADKGVTIWLDGGWGVDALLEKQTRLHGDLDLTIEKKNVEILDKLLQSRGYREILRSDSSDQNYVLSDDEARLIDVHVIELDEAGNGIYGPIEDGVMYPAAALTGTGMINDIPVKCISPEWVVKFHSGYELRPSDIADVKAVRKKFGV